jgi:hypothetical protein
MADDILKNIPLPADLPENWTSGQIIAPTGAEAGLDDQHGYNYLMKQVNNAQKALKALAAQREEDLARIKFWTSNDPTSPASFIGGTWERIEGEFIMGASDTYPAGSTGGEAKVAITVEQMPRHKHDWLGVMNKRNGEVDYSNYAPDINEDHLVSSYNSKAGVQYAGEGKPHNNIPPYYSMYIWRRVA